MISRRQLLEGSAATVFAPLASRAARGQQPAAKITILFDAFGKPSNLKRGWGYAAFVEYGGRC